MPSGLRVEIKALSWVAESEMPSLTDPLDDGIVPDRWLPINGSERPSDGISSGAAALLEPPKNWNTRSKNAACAGAGIANGARTTKTSVAALVTTTPLLLKKGLLSIF